MGREIRRVPPNWQHPQEEKFNPFKMVTETRFKPLFDRAVEDAWKEWNKEYKKWLGGEHDRVLAEYGEGEYPKAEPYRAFCHWHGQPPDPAYYRPVWKKEDATWYQVYETVSEGTPVTPPFETQDELIGYLVANGDFWDQSRRKDGHSAMPCGPWPREQAERFVKGPGWAPSLIVANGKVMSGVEALTMEAKD